MELGLSRPSSSFHDRNARTKALMFSLLFTYKTLSTPRPILLSSYTMQK